MLNKKLAENALSLIASNPILLNGSMPNLPLPVMDKGVFWNTISSVGGYKLEQNMITQHCRILDSNSIRRAWGTEEAMERLLNKIVSSN